MEWLASIDGEPIGHARAFPGPRGLLLDGAATLPQARGRGAYRALDRRTLGGSSGARHAGARRAGRRNVATDPRAVRVRARLHHVRSGTRSAVNDALREFAQSPDRYTRIPADVDRFADERDLRPPGQHVGRGFRRARRRQPAWPVSSPRCVSWSRPRKRSPGGSTPVRGPPTCTSVSSRSGLRDPHDRGSLLHAVACVSEPSAGPADVEVSRVDTFDDHLAATEVMWDAFDTPSDRREAQRPHLRSEFEAARTADVPGTFLARVDGRPAGVGRSVYSDRGVFLIAGCVAEWARGRGVYRALVRARWDDAVARGTPALISEAMPDTSYPILKRVGFVDVCTIRRVEDPR